VAPLVGRGALALLIAFSVLVGWGEAQTPKPAPNPPGPVQGYQGGYDPTDKSRAPAARDGKKTDAANPDEGRPSRDVSGLITGIDGRRLVLDSGMVLVLLPTMPVDRDVLTVGARITATYEDRDGSYVVTAIRRVSG